MVHSPTLPSLAAWIWEGLAIFLIVLRFCLRFMLWQQRKNRQQQQQQEWHIFHQGDAWALVAAVFVGTRLGVGVYAEIYDLKDGNQELTNGQKWLTEESVYSFEMVEKITILLRVSLLCILWSLKAAAFCDLIPFLEDASTRKWCRGTRGGVLDRLLSCTLYVVLFLTFFASLLTIFLECPWVGTGAFGSVVRDLYGQKVCADFTLWVTTYEISNIFTNTIILALTLLLIPLSLPSFRRNPTPHVSLPTLIPRSSPRKRTSPIYTTCPHVPHAHPDPDPPPRSIPAFLAPISLTILASFLLALNALRLTAYGLRTSDVVLRSRASWATPEVEVAVFCALVALLGASSSSCPSRGGHDATADGSQKGNSNRGGPGDEQGARGWWTKGPRGGEGQGGWDASMLEPSFPESYSQPFPAYDLDAQNHRLRRQSSADLFPLADDVMCSGDGDSTCWIERASSGATRVASRNTMLTRARGISASTACSPMLVSTSHDGQPGVPAPIQTRHQDQAGDRNTGNAGFGDNDNDHDRDHDYGHGDDDLRGHLYDGEVVFFRTGVPGGDGGLLSPRFPSTAAHQTPPPPQSAHRVPSWRDLDSETATDIGDSDTDDHHRPPTPMVPDAVARVVSLSSGFGDSEAGDGRTWRGGTDAAPGDERRRRRSRDRERRGRSRTADAGAILVARLVTIPPRASVRLSTF
ncbi:hypothetical protein F4809DRAFT_656733 [Biscogniauxia mediterranea]|nr:hypothetical protein F4809DRAFT_656733 [Biscogniauxia mediterranea]